MTPRHANRGPDGKLVRADAKPVLHRQVPEPVEMYGVWCKFDDGQWRRVDVGQPDPATAEWLQLTAPKDPHGPRIELSWPLVFFVAGLVLVMAAGVWLMGVDGGLW